MGALMRDTLREPLAELLREYPQEVIDELRTATARLNDAERERLKTQAYRCCPGLWERDDWSEFDALPADLKAEVETGIRLTVLETIDHINVFLGLCNHGRAD
jgi:hypothetical protein